VAIKYPPRTAESTDAVTLLPIIGQPNSGKTTIFNQLTGDSQQTGNYPGVTVSPSEASFTRNGSALVRDLPGLYSLRAYSADELAAVEEINRHHQVTSGPVLVVVDATNLRRHLHIAVELLVSGRPMIIACNKMDLLRESGATLDTDRLSQWLGTTVIPVVATSGEGISKLDRAISDATAESFHQSDSTIPLNEDSSEAERAGWIDHILSEVLSLPSDESNRSDRADKVLAHPVWGTAIFIATMTTVFMSLFSWAAPLMGMIDAAFGGLSGWLAGILPDGVFSSFICDGLIAGVGGVVIFLPQILILFVFISILEECGYMARSAVLTDRWLRWCGLSGQSFIPLLSSFACAIPGVMATRSIHNRRDRFATILVAPLMSCSARLPVYAILTAAFIPAANVLGFLPLQGLVFASMYFVGIIVAMLVAVVLRKTILRGAPSMLLIELPPYRKPSLAVVARRSLNAGKAFLIQAGTIILAMSVIIWALCYFPRPAALEQQVRTAELAKGSAPVQIDAVVEGTYLRQSYMGRMGRAVEPIVKPLGWDWRIGMATIAAFPAREVVISTLGIIYDVGEADEESTELIDQLRAAAWPDGRKIFTVPVALSIMVFFALCAQCGSTLAVIKRETRSWRWPIFAFIYMTALAYIAALTVTHAGRWISS
jgi:ferrous iron transport protein B